MKTTTISLPDEVLDRLRSEARKRGTSMAQVMRRALEEHLRMASPTASLRDVPKHRGGRLLRPWSREEVFDEMLDANEEDEAP
jgi:predicted transcriptional regulator